ARRPARGRPDDRGDCAAVRARPADRQALAETISGIDLNEVRRIQQGLPALFAVLSARHAVEALGRAASDPATAVKSTFGAKLAAEAGRLTVPAADRPGLQIMAFVRSLTVNPGRGEAGQPEAFNQAEPESRA